MPAVDSLAVIGPDLFGGGQEAPAVLESMRRLGIDVTVAAPARPPGYVLGPANEALAVAARSSGGAIVGLGRVDPNQADAADEAVRCVRRLGLAGLFLHPWQEVFRANGPRAVAVLSAFAAAGGRIVVVATGVPWLSEAPQVADLAGRFPRVSFVMTNGGQFNISGLGQQDAMLALSEHPNLYIQTTGVYRQDFIEGVVARLGAERVMYAGGSPWFEPGFEVLRVRRAKVSDADRDLLCGGTAARVFGL